MVLLSVKSIQGKRDYMEDRYAYLERNGIIIAMVCDGHGGDKIADLTAQELPKKLLAVLSKITGTNVAHAAAIRDTIIDWGSQVFKIKSGSTLTGIAVKNGIVYVYNVGDSRTCFKLIPNTFVYHLVPTFDSNGDFNVEKIIINYSQQQFFCTVDHDPDSKVEQTRIKNAGGRIVGERLNGILSVTRALGDADVGNGISAIPDVYWTNQSNIISPVFMYSDGIYEPQRYAKNGEQKFDNRYLHYLATMFGSEVVVKYAYDNGSDDNITALVVRV